MLCYFSDPVEIKLVNFEAIHAKYAKRYDLKKFKGYMKTILKNYKDETQQFEKKNDVEPWSQRNKKSRGWHLLYDLMIDEKSNRTLSRMSLEEIHQSNKCFSCYPIDKFKKYHRDMVNLTGEWIECIIKLFSFKHLTSLIL